MLPPRARVRDRWRALSRRPHRVGLGQRRAPAEPLGGAQRRPDAVLVEPPAPVGAAVVGPPLARDLLPAALGDHALGGEDRVGVVDRADHRRRIDRLGQVEGDEEVAIGPERLQAVHVVGHRRPACRPIGQVVVPARPGGAAPRHQARVRVEHGLVSLIGNRPEDGRLGGGSGRRACGVRRSEWTASTDLVEALARVIEGDAPPPRAAVDAAHRGAKVNPVAERLDQSPRRSDATRP